MERGSDCLQIVHPKVPELRPVDFGRVGCPKDVQWCESPAADDEYCDYKVANAAIARAFEAAKDRMANASGAGDGFVERKEFKLLVSYLRRYLELFVMFLTIDKSKDGIFLGAQTISPISLKIREISPQISENPPQWIPPQNSTIGERKYLRLRSTWAGRDPTWNPFPYVRYLPYSRCLCGF